MFIYEQVSVSASLLDVSQLRFKMGHFIFKFPSYELTIIGRELNETFVENEMIN